MQNCKCENHSKEILSVSIMASAVDILLGCAELIFLYAVALVLGWGVSKIPQALGVLVQLVDSSVNTKSWPPLPDFLGMLLAGILLANVPGNLLGAIRSVWSSYIRKAALTIILSRAGLSLDVAALRSLGAATLRLASIPCAVEASVAAVMTKLLREDISWGFCFCLGFILAAVSPAVVIPSLLALQDSGYGGHISTMVLAAASLDDVIAICGLGIALDIAFSQVEGGGGQASIIWTASIAPITIFGGIFVGAGLGYLQYLLTRHTYRHKTIGPIVCSDIFRAGLLFATSLVVVYTTSAYDFDAAGYLAVMVAGFVLARGWDSIDDISEQGSPLTFSGTKAVSSNFKLIWTYVMPALFMLIGAQVNLSDITASVLGTAVAVLVVGLFIRLLVTFGISGYGTDMSSKEKMFIAIAWFPKATVQAALGSVVLDRANELSIDDDDVAADVVDIGKFVLTAAVLAIILTAPLGAIGIYITGPLWLKRTSPDSNDSAVTETIESAPSDIIDTDKRTELDLANGSLVEMIEAADPGSVVAKHPETTV